MIYLLEFVFRGLHVLGAIVWVGLLFYFNFVQGEFLKEASESTRKEVVQGLVPKALWWFRWASVATVLTGGYLLFSLGSMANQYIVLSALMGFIMFLNVWLVIWPQQKVVCGLVSGEVAVAASKAMLASRTNVLLSAPMLFGMLGSKHAPLAGATDALNFADAGFIISLLAVLAIEANGLFGKLGYLAVANTVIGLSLCLTVIMYLGLHFL